MSKILDLILTFGKIGCFTFGGGYAMISLIEHTCVEQKKWLSNDEMLDVTVIAESTPGPIAINCATYVGQKQAGLPGAVAATFGMVLPSFLILYGISLYLAEYQQILWIDKAFHGIRVAVGILILDAGLTMVRKMPKAPFARKTAILAFCIMLGADLMNLHLSSVALMLLAGVASLIRFKLADKSASKKEVKP